MIEDIVRESIQNYQAHAVQLQITFSGCPGSPAFNLPIQGIFLRRFVENKFSVSAMASMLKSVNRLWTVNFKKWISSQYANLSEYSLDSIVMEILQQFAKSGYKRFDCGDRHF